MFKHFLLLLLLIFSVNNSYSQKNDARTGSQNVFIKIDGASAWSKFDAENATTVPATDSGNENVAFYAGQNGIFISILRGSNKIKLFALTGQLLLNGDLAQGRFFIPTRPGIYFLKINTKSYKVICK